MKKFLVFLLVFIFTFSLVGCGEPNEDNSVDDSHIQIDGISPELRINSNGYWEISYDEGDSWVSLNAKAHGKDGENGKDGKDGRGIEKVEIIDGEFWITYSNDLDNPVNVGNAEQADYYLQDLIESVFEIKKDQFISQSKTLDNPIWCYTTSTFSGWGGSIGKPETLEAVAIKIRARATAITQIKFFLSKNDKNGEIITSETLNVNVPANQEADIVWKLPKKLVNNTNSLYLTYNCNQFCDLYSNTNASADISSNHYSAVMTYTTNGNLLDSPSKMTDSYGKPTKYIYAILGLIKDTLEFKDTAFTESKTINVFLPDRYDLAVNDNFQLFYRGVVQAVNPYNYDIVVTCSKGKEYPRYFEWTPTESDIGTHKLTLKVYDDNGNLLGSDSTTLNVCAPKTTNETQNVLCIGDSLTTDGTWVYEARRRFTKTGGSPEGLGLNYLNFIGTKINTIAGEKVPCEGYGGWTWEKFCSSASPFYDQSISDISFKSYCTKNGFSDIDVVYILLTWNGHGVPYKTDYAFDKGHFVYAQKILDKIHAEYPNAIIRCMGIQMPSQIGGMGANYGASGGYSNDYGMLVSAMNYNATLESLCNSTKYKNFVKYVDVAGQFDTDYNMPSTNKPVNNRNNTSEVIGTNGVHPSISGYYQIADAVYRSLCELFSK